MAEKGKGAKLITVLGVLTDETLPDQPTAVVKLRIFLLGIDVL